MDNCRIFKDLILTDYIDGQLMQEKKEQIRAHLLVCPSCRQLAEEVRNDLSTPLKEAERKEVPPELWSVIKERIEKETPLRVWIQNLIRGWQGLFPHPRLVPVALSLLLLFIIGSVSFQNLKINQAREQEQGEYLASLLEPTTDTNSGGLGTPIEQYFL